MKNTQSSLVYLFAVLGICAVGYGGWYLYQRHTANEQAKAAFTAPAANGVPDMYHDAPPPPQP